MAILTMLSSRFRRTKRRFGTKVAKLDRRKRAVGEVAPKDRTDQHRGQMFESGEMPIIGAGGPSLGEGDGVAPARAPRHPDRPPLVA